MSCDHDQLQPGVLVMMDDDARSHGPSSWTVLNGHVGLVVRRRKDSSAMVEITFAGQLIWCVRGGGGAYFLTLLADEGSLRDEERT